jgi:hypothetical protein
MSWPPTGIENGFTIALATMIGWAIGAYRPGRNWQRWLEGFARIARDDDPATAIHLVLPGPGWRWTCEPRAGGNSSLVTNRRESVTCPRCEYFAKNMDRRFS